MCTSSFVVAGGGFCFLMLNASHWLIDVRGVRRGTAFFNVVGMNSLFI
jgi:predicted acyltransferase